MYAIVDIAGQQFKVEKDQKYFVHQLDAKPGSKITFENVLLLDDKGKVTVGAPSINGIQVTAKIEQHLLGNKVIVFKKKRRKGYRVKNGHRQAFTQIEIQSILEKGAKVKKANVATAKNESKAEPKAVAKKAPANKATPKAKTANADKPKAANKKTTAKKPAAKKTTAKKTDK